MFASTDDNQGKASTITFMGQPFDTSYSFAYFTQFFWQKISKGKRKN